MFRIFSLVSLFLKYSFVSCVFWSEKVDKLQKTGRNQTFYQVLTPACMFCSDVFFMPIV